MTHFVPQWDGMSSHSLKFFDNAHVRQFARGGAHPQHHPALQKKSSAALVPDQDALEVSLTQMGIQGAVAGGSHLSAGEVNHTSVPTLDVSLVMTNPCFHDDEMVSWLQYPLENSLDRNYCSDMFGDLLNPHLHLVKDAFLYQTMREPVKTIELEGFGHEQAELHQLRTARSMPCARLGMKSDEAMAMGAGRAAGLVSQAGSEVFTSVRTHVHPAVSFKPSSSCGATESFFDGKKNFEAYDPMMGLLDSKEALMVPSPIPAPSSVSNFSHFSRPLAATMEGLRIVGAASGPSNVERARQPAAKTLPLPCEPSANSESNGSAVMSMQPSSQPPARLSSQSEVVRDGVGCTVAGWSLPTATLCGSDMLQCRPVVRMLDETAKLNSHGPCFSGSAITVSEDALRTEATDAATVSPSRLSGSSNEEAADELLTLTLKKKSSLEYTEDAEDFTANARKPPPGPSATKRSRAAETHNESEKKRRNKINVRLKALQNLIPNSNKTDKASVLDEAIEYTKMLQAQLQFMSMRTGMLVPQLMMPGGMHYVSVPQMPMAPLGIGMGYGVGSDMDLSMCVADINAAAASLGVTGAGAGAGAVVSSSPTFNHSAYVGARPQQISSVPLSQHASLCAMPTTGIGEPYKLMLPQHPLQMNAGMYNALVQQRLPQEISRIGQPQENDS